MTEARVTGRRLFAARESFSTDIAGTPVVVHKGELVREGHPLLEGREGLFEPYEQRVAFDVEQATASPGEKRGGRS